MLNLPEQILPLGQLCNANKSNPIKFVLLSDKTNKILHQCVTTVDDLEAGRTQMTAGGNANLSVLQMQVYQRPTFVEYLRSGWGVSLVAAIDYTASNGDPSNPRSLHYMGKNNQYESALNNVGMVVEPYDSDRSFPVFGFGGIPRHLGLNSVNHCFAMNGNPSDPNITGIQ